MVLDVVVNWSNYYVIKCFWEVECYGTELNDLIMCTEEEELAHEKIRSSVYYNIAAGRNNGHNYSRLRAVYLFSSVISHACERVSSVELRSCKT